MKRKKCPGITRWLLWAALFRYDFLHFVVLVDAKISVFIVFFFFFCFVLMAKIYLLILIALQTNMESKIYKCNGKWVKTLLGEALMFANFH